MYSIQLDLYVPILKSILIIDSYPFGKLGVHHKVVHMFLCSCQFQFTSNDGNDQCCTTSALYKIDFLFQF